LIVQLCIFFFFQAEDGIRDRTVTGVQTCALPILEGCSHRCEETRIAVRDVQHEGTDLDVGGRDRDGGQGGPALEHLRRAEDATRSEERRVGKEWRARWAGGVDKRKSEV